MNVDKLASYAGKSLTRRGLLVTGAAAGAGVALGIGTIADSADAQTAATKKSDAAILNGALFYEHQAIWAYGFAAGKLSQTDVGKAVLALALRNQADHKQHRDTLMAVVKSLGGTPVKAQAQYDVSSYLKRGEGGLDSDVNIAKLALALEVDAALAYTKEVAMLKTPALITAGASIGSTESAHAAAIRATFKGLGVPIEIVPASFVSQANRGVWVLKV